MRFTSVQKFGDRRGYFMETYKLTNETIDIISEKIGEGKRPKR